MVPGMQLVGTDKPECDDMLKRLWSKLLDTYCTDNEMIPYTCKRMEWRNGELVVTMEWTMTRL
jgi:hypothetical protein